MGLRSRLWRAVGRLRRLPPADPATAPRSQFDKWRAMGVTIGKDCAIYDAFFDTLAPFLIEVGDRVIFSGGVSVLAHDAAMLGFRGQERFAKVRILDDCFIGHKSIIMPGVTIGPRSIVAAGSVVTKDVPPRTIVGGNPAKPIASLDEYLAKLDAGKVNGRMVDMKWVGKEDPRYQEHRRALDRELRDLHAKGFFD